jgi:hypothetical protein
MIVFIGPRDFDPRGDDRSLFPLRFDPDNTRGAFGLLLAEMAAVWIINILRCDTPCCWNR